MRHLFLDKKMRMLNAIAQPFIDEEASLLVAVRYSYIYQIFHIARVVEAHANALKHMPEKIKLAKDMIFSGAINVKNDPYSFSGVVIAAGKGVSGYMPGDWVAGFVYYGHFSEVIRVRPCDIVKLDIMRDVVSHASILATVVAALHIVHRAQMSIGHTVCIVGVDVLGQCVVQLARLAGCTVIAVDVNHARCEQARQSGAAYVFHSEEDDVGRALSYITHHQGVDRIILLDVDTVQKSIPWISTLIKRHGMLLMHEDNIAHYIRDLVRNSDDITIAYVRSSEMLIPDDMQAHQMAMCSCLQMIQTEKVMVRHLIGSIVPVSKLEDAYKELQFQRACGVVIQVSSEELPSAPVHREMSSFTMMHKNKMRVGIIGSGQTKSSLLSVLSSLPQIELKAVIGDEDLHTSDANSTYKGALLCSLDDELLQSDAVDVLCITSSHKYHAAHIVQALKKQKAVFVEKPMVVNFAQLDQIMAIWKKSAVPLCVDYHRSYAPFMRKIKQALSYRTTPLMINYRVHMGTALQEGPHDAGRIIGQAGDFVDLFCFLTDSLPKAVSVEAVHTPREDIFPTDNFCAQIHFADGSLCCLYYTVLGYAKCHREYMDVCFDGKTIMMTDYVRLEGFGLPSRFNEVVSVPDKGYAHLVHAFMQSLQHPPFQPPIPSERIEHVAYTTLMIDQLACRGGGTREII